MHFATMAQNCNLQAPVMLSFLDFSHFSNNRISLSTCWQGLII